jgi:carbon monoxide dehydrogenase subunit G
MQLEHTFTVPVEVDEAWKALLDIERIAPCMPGAAIDSVDGDDFTGTVKVRVGPIGLTYKGKASFVEKDAEAHRAVIDARGRDARGNGTANAKITASLASEGASTHVRVVTDLDITGKPAQFGRGVMTDVGNKLIGQFADCLAGKLTAGDDPGPAASGGTDAASSESEAAPPGAPVTPAAESAAAQPAAGGTPASSAAADTSAPAAAAEQPPSPRRPGVDEVEPIDLIGSAGPAVAKRLVPVLAAVLLLVVLLRLLRRRG